jgi:hypothetical protein
VTIQLVSDVSEALQEASLTESLLECKPSIKGEYAWVDSRTLEFRPEEMLDPGTVYDCKFQLHKLMEVPDPLKVLKFQFQTIQQSLSVELNGLNSLDEEDLQWQQLNGTLKTADYAETEAVEKVLAGSQKGKTLRVHWTHNSEGTMHNFVIDSIFRTKEKEQVVVKWNGGGIRSKDQGEEVVSIPPLGDFKVMNTYVRQQPEQYISLFFSDPISKSQELRGLIYLESGEDVRLELDGSEAKVYPTSRLQGTKTIIISDAVRNTLDYNLIESYRRDVEFTSINPEVKLIGDGVILPGSDGLTFPFKAVNLKAVNVRIIKIFENNIHQFFQENHFNGDNEIKRVGRIILNKEVLLSSEKPIDYGNWNMFSLDLAELIETEPGAIYNISISFDRDQSLLPCAGDKGKSELEPYKEDLAVDRFNNPPEGHYYGGYGYYRNYNWNEREDPCKDSYYI